MKNRPPNVFLSSTMYDLSELRARFCRILLGRRAVLGEPFNFCRRGR